MMGIGLGLQVRFGFLQRISFEVRFTLGLGLHVVCIYSRVRSRPELFVRAKGRFGVSCKFKFLIRIRFWVSGNIRVRKGVRIIFRGLV